MISRKTDNFTGFILDGNRKCYFYSSEKVFHFIAEGVGIFAESVKRVIPTPDEFMYGYTTDGYQIALYTGSTEKEIKVNGAFRPGIFFVSKANAQRYDMTTFSSVRFRGGTLNNLYKNSAVKAMFDENENIYKREYVPFNNSYNLCIDGKKCALTMFSMPSDEQPEIMDLCVRFEFDEAIPVVYVKRIFHIISETCRIMTNRQNVGFDNIELYKRDESTSKWYCFAEGVAYYTYDSFTKKSHEKNVLFEHLGAKVTELMELIDSDKERASKYTFDFMPLDDDDMYVISNDKIKSTCSALECEMSFIKDWNSKQSSSLNTLIETVKQVIKDHKDSDDRLDDKTYENIFSSIGNWDMPSAVKMYILYQKYSTYMKHFEDWLNMKCNEENINSLVRYRNDVTHGRYRSLDEDIATTAYILMALSYCCFWKRIGLGDDTLEKLVTENRVL